MKVARLHGPGDIRLHDEPMPAMTAGETLLRVCGVGICGSDLHWLAEGGIGDAQLAAPLILGHEFSGMTDTGRRVAVDPAVPCGECEMCRTGNQNLCPRVVFAGHGDQDGALREFMTWPTRCLHQIPDSMDFAEGAMLEPLGIALHAVDLGRIRAGDTVGVIGCGPIGLLIIQLVRMSGAISVIAVDRLAHRVEAARGYGAHHAILARGGEEIAQIRSSIADRHAVDVAFEAAGEQEAVDAAIELAAPGARVILVGIPASDRTSFGASTARRKGLTIKLVRRMRNAYTRSIQLVQGGAIEVRSLVTHRYPLKKMSEAFAVAARRDGIKVLVEPG
jgi:L-iditol 2-dehydrogenase